MDKEYGRAFLRKQESILSKMLSFTPLMLPFSQIALQKEKSAKRAFARGVQESILREQLSDNLLSQQVLPN